MDELSGAKAARPGLQQAMDSLREGDVLVVWRLDRLGRSLRNLLVGREAEGKEGWFSEHPGIHGYFHFGREFTLPGLWCFG